jgi:hypothetical protein
MGFRALPKGNLPSPFTGSCVLLFIRLSEEGRLRNSVRIKREVYYRANRIPFEFQTDLVFVYITSAYFSFATVLKASARNEMMALCFPLLCHIITTLTWI